VTNSEGKYEICIAQNIILANKLGDSEMSAPRMEEKKNAFRI
jgi:hypothetical protein